jgi:hypothetical protein
MFYCKFWKYVGYDLKTAKVNANIAGSGSARTTVKN